MPHFFVGEKMNDTNTPSTLNEMINLLESVKTDYDKFYVDGNSSAGTRVRCSDSCANNKERLRIRDIRREAWDYRCLNIFVRKETIC